MISKKRVDRLRESHLSLRRRFFETNDQLIKCEHLKVTYQRMVAFQKDVKGKLEREIEFLTRKIDDLSAFKEQLGLLVQKYSVFEAIAANECLNGGNISEKCDTLCEYFQGL